MRETSGSKRLFFACFGASARSRDCELSGRHRFISFPIGMKEGGERDACLYCPRP